jgi:hypothetical protein
MPDGSGGGSNTFLGLIVGALFVAVVGIGSFVYLNHRSAPATPSVSISLPAAPATH